MENSSASYLVLFTEQYPFGEGEGFLDEEIKFLSTKFLTIYICPRKTGREKRLLPNNVVINASLLRYGICDVLRSFLKCNFDYRELNHVLKRNYKNNSALKTLKNYFGYEIIGNIYKDRINSFQIDNSIYYSYWFKHTAYSLALSKKPNNGVKICRCHGSDIYEINYGHPFREKIGKELDQLFTISNQGKEYILRNYHIEKDKLETSNLGTKRLFNFSKREPRDYILSVSCSNCIELKRIDLICRVVEKLAFNHPNLCFKHVHFGAGPLLNHLKSIYNESIDNVEIDFRGSVRNEDIQLFYSKLVPDYFINLSESEGLPVSMMEAISYGIPLVGTDVGGVKEIVNKETGILIPKDFQIQDLIESIYQNIIDKNHFNRKTIMDFWTQNFNSAKNYASFYSKLLELSWTQNIKD